MSNLQPPRATAARRSPGQVAAPTVLATSSAATAMVNASPLTNATPSILPKGCSIKYAVSGAVRSVRRNSTMPKFDLPTLTEMETELSGEPQGSNLTS